VGLFFATVVVCVTGVNPRMRQAIGRGQVRLFFVGSSEPVSFAQPF
jgi:hypothetical protein